MEGRSQHHQLIDENKGFQYLYLNLAVMPLIISVRLLVVPIATTIQ